MWYKPNESMYHARQLGLDAKGAVSDPRRYGSETKHAPRENLARVAYSYVSLLRPLPKYLAYQAAARPLKG